LQIIRHTNRDNLDSSGIHHDTVTCRTTAATCGGRNDQREDDMSARAPTRSAGAWAWRARGRVVPFPAAPAACAVRESPAQAEKGCSRPRCPSEGATPGRASLARAHGKLPVDTRPSNGEGDERAGLDTSPCRLRYLPRVWRREPGVPAKPASHTPAPGPSPVHSSNEGTL
jgi:hypothetical protein